MREHRWLPYAAVALVAAALYLQTLRFDYVFDDKQLIVNNAFLSEPWSPVRAFHHEFWYGTAFVGYYRPLVIASFALNGRILGWGPGWFHLVNVLLHIANAVLLLAVARRGGVAPGPAALAAMIFAVHPATSWPVASVAARVDLLSAFFVLLAWQAWLAVARPPAPRSPFQALWRAVLVGVLFLCALLSKESAAAFLAVPVLGTRRMAPSRGREPAGSGAGPAAGPSGRWASLAAAALAFLAYLGLRTWAGLGVGVEMDRTRVNPMTNPLAHLPLPGRLYAALALCGRYLRYIVFPVRFTDHADYALSAPPPALGAGAVVTALVLMLWGALILILWLRRDRLSQPLALSLGSFFAASNLVVPIGSLYALNFLYLPLAGLCLALAEALARWMPRAEAAPDETSPIPRRWVWVAAPLVTLLAAGSAIESRIWRDDVSLLTTFTRRFPHLAMAWVGLGEALLDRGDKASAIASFGQAQAINGASAGRHNEIAVALTRGTPTKGQLEEALSHLHTAVILNPQLVEPRINAARILIRLGRAAEAEPLTRETLRVSPDSIPARQALAESLFQQSKYAEAATELKELVRVRPEDPDVRSPFVVSLIHAGDLAEARRAAEEARRAFPDLAWFDFCLARVEAKAGRKTEALALLKRSRQRDASTLEWIRKVNDFDSYRGTPGFDELVGR